MKFRCRLIVASMFCLTNALWADSNYAAWLRYSALPRPVAGQYALLPANVVVMDRTPILASARHELIRGVYGMLGRDLRVQTRVGNEPSVILGTDDELQEIIPGRLREGIQPDSFQIRYQKVRGINCLIVSGAGGSGVLYGVFALLSRIARGESFDANYLEQPHAPLRWVNQWDNLDGRIERGYAGPSIFFKDGTVRSDLTRVADYARLLASVNINGCTINNVNADPRFLDNTVLSQVVRIADVFRPWGIKLSLAVDLSSPKVIGGLDTFDPLDTQVIAWWKRKVDEIYREIPDFGGFVVKADSEGRAGPSSYGRTAADAANVIARALEPHGGVLLYRAFVYNHHLDWRNLKNDRARAAYDVFHPLDGKFDDNVVIQIKYGPIDFQVREPVSPLFGGLERTNEAIELQITQEYTGQQRHLCFLVPMWKETLDFDMHVEETSATVKDLIAGKNFHRATGGFIGVANVGMDDWLENPLAMANLYGFGRLAWNPNLSEQTIVDEWTRLTFGNNQRVVQVVSGLQLSSWNTYESYTGNLGIGTLTDILGSHYGPGPESSERNGWGQWHRADHNGVGMDRTVATGTGYISQYSPAVQKLYDSLADCPDDLLLFFHHVPYTHLLHSGKPVIQQIYDSHYEGADRASQYVRDWESLKGFVDRERYESILSRLKYQAAYAIVWRDAICQYFFELSGIQDQKGRVGHHPS